jgi:glycosyltransferase involved in cell wall biosynthesis
MTDAGPSLPKRILYVFNSSAFFASHRLDVARRFGAAGVELHLAAPAPFPAEVEAAVCCHPWALERGRANPRAAGAALASLRRILPDVDPDLAEFASIQPAILGGLAVARRTELARVYWITGLGWAFTGRGFRARLAGVAARAGYRFALRSRRARTIFENPEDELRFVSSGLTLAGHSTVIPGAGVDLERFRPAPEPAGEPVVLLAARLLRSKGVEDYLEAATLLRHRGVRCRFLLAGDPDVANPESLDAAAVHHRAGKAGVEWVGHRADMPALLSAAHIACLPSWAEGCPKFLLEAAAAGRAAVGTDIPGIRAVIRPGETGVLVSVRDSKALAGAIERLVRDSGLRQRLGAAARRRAEAEFGVATIADRVARVYADALTSSA